MPGPSAHSLAHLAQIVGEDKAGAAAVRAVNDDDLLVRQVNARVVLGDASVVPVVQLAEVDVGKHIAAQFDFRNAGNVVNGNHGAQSRWECERA